VFRKPGDFAAFLTALSDLKERKPFELFGYCLLNNHFHLLIRPLETPISRLLQSLLVSHTQRYHKHHHSSGHVWQGRFKSPVIQDDEHLLTVLRYIEANPLRAKIVERAEDYPYSSYRVHGLGEPSELVDGLIPYEQLSPYARVRQRKWAATVHLPQEEESLAAIRRSAERGLPYGSEAWVKRLSKQLGIDLAIRPRGRPKKQNPKSNKSF
jgi:putative transposase